MGRTVKMPFFLLSGGFMKSRGIRWGMCVGFLLCFAVPCLGGETDETDASEKKSPCFACHETVTPGIVRQFLDSKMAETMDCSDCHGAGHTTRDDVIQAKLPTPDTCADCHEVHVMQYRTGKHALAWSAMQALPMVRHQPIAIAGDEASKGCPECHEIGDKPIGEMKRYGTGPCDSCHTRHSFSLKEARDPRVCRSCHMGSDHRQWEMWSTSKHGTIWEIDPASGRAPTCQNCHMPDGHHGVVTAWGFLALRLPEEDKEWLADRVTILQALGILDDAGNPTERFDGVKATKLMRLNKEEFDIQRGKMLDICASCKPATGSFVRRTAYSPQPSAP
jgi:hydroxylamine dehydrogenase